MASQELLHGLLVVLAGVDTRVESINNPPICEPPFLSQSAGGIPVFIVRKSFCFTEPLKTVSEIMKASAVGYFPSGPPIDSFFRHLPGSSRWRAMSTSVKVEISSISDYSAVCGALKFQGHHV